MEASFATKQADFKTANMGRMAAGAVENQVTQLRPDLERWTTQLSQETVSATTTNLQTIAKHLSGKEFQQTAFPTRDASGGLGTLSTQKSSQIRIAFRGTFRSMQKAFLELETQMPQ